MRILITLILAIISLPAAGQAPDSIDARVDGLWHPFTSQYQMPGRIIVVDAYRSDDGAVTAYRAWQQGRHVHTVFKRDDTCFTARTGDVYAKPSSCRAFNQYFRHTKQLWARILARNATSI